MEGRSKFLHMLQNKFYIKNGEIEKKEAFRNTFEEFTHPSFLYYTDIRLINTVPVFLKEHIDALKSYSENLLIEFPQKINDQKISALISRLLNINKVYKGGIARLVIEIRANVVCNYYLTIEKIDDLFFEISDVGQKTDLFELRNSKYSFNSVKIYSDYNDCLFDNFCTSNNLDSCIVECDGNVTDASSGNLFVLKNNNVCIPSVDISKGGKICSEVIFLLEQNGFVLDFSRCNADILLNADELFIINNIKGIQWIQQFKNKFYYNKVSRQIAKQLNDKIINYQS